MIGKAYYAAGSAWAYLNKHRPMGKPIWSEDWDICIILDSARADTLADLAPREWSQASAWSVGSITTEWLSTTFSARYSDDISDSALVSATPHTDTVFRRGHWLTNQDDIGFPYPGTDTVDIGQFDAFHEIWKTHASVENVVPPHVMHDATIEAYEKYGSQVISHWMQPHEPFISPHARVVGGDALSENVWTEAAKGELRESDLRQSYRANLGYALEYVESLLTKVDARVLITADHGNAFGEWGIWGHPFGWPQPAVRRVPWVTVDASPLREPSTDGILETSEETSCIDEQLRSLGYL